MANSTKIIVGMSGGVDSSVAALLLLQQGYDVTGLFMKNWEGDDTAAYCPATQDLADAQAVCTQLGIPLLTVNFAKMYWQRVFQYFLAEYRAGRTPNPDVLCNKEIKFRAFLDYALENGADFIATGHYARILRDSTGVKLLKGCDPQKDQSYFLNALSQEQLRHSLFPVGELQKTAVRELAREHSLVTHHKKDSTGICFIGERKFKDFLQEYLLAQPGDIVTLENKKIGRHQGLMYYTLGQRQGLHIGGLRDAAEAAWYVVDKDIEQNRLMVAQGHDHPRLFAQGLLCQQVNWISGAPPNLSGLSAKIRYRQEDQTCELTPLANGQYQVIFTDPQRAITPGQFVVFYHGEECLGGGVISAIMPDCN